MLLLPKRFADTTLPTVSYDGVANFLADGEPQSRRSGVAAGANHEHIVGRKMIFLVHAREIVARKQTL